MINNDLDHNKRLFLDMQEHPEQYSDEQLEAMMADIDREPDTEDAWMRLADGMERMPLRKERGAMGRRWMRVAALFLGVLTLTGMAVAAIRLFQSHPLPAPTATEASTPYATFDGQSSKPVHFDNVTLDSILTVVAAHYHKAVSFRADEPRRMKLIMTWQPEAPLADFMERLNAFDGLSLLLQGDTIVVDTIALPSM